VVFEPQYKERRSGTKIADFALATHPDEETTHYWGIRAFNKTAEYVHTHFCEGQTAVEASVYGPKQWTVRNKRQDGSWENREVEGYYAGFVRVPKRYRAEQLNPEPKSDM
jgi:hypothetical protein